jgi:hypothetical protein
LDELDALRGHGTGKWALDLTDTALFMHLGTWGEKYHQLDVYCDETKALDGFADSIGNTMIDRKEKFHNTFFDCEQPITFNLPREISFVKSHECPGVQLADAVAGATIYALSKRDDSQTRKWINYFPSILHPICVIMPDNDHIDPYKIENQRNALLLYELVARSERGISLTEGIDRFLTDATQHLLSDRAPLLKR